MPLTLKPPTQLILTILSLDGAAPHPSALNLDTSARLKLEVFSVPRSRDPLLSMAIVLALCPATNPRYTPQRSAAPPGELFAKDYCEAHGVPLPPSHVGLHTGLELEGMAHGWRECTWSGEAQQLANQGHPVLATRPGHVAVVRPGRFAPDAPWLAQSGPGAFNLGSFERGCGEGTARFWVHISKP